MTTLPEKRRSDPPSAERSRLHWTWLALVCALTLLAWSILRATLGARLVWDGQLSSRLLSEAMVRGLRFDLATLAYLVAPWLLGMALIPQRWNPRPWMTQVRWLTLAALIFSILFACVGEWIFWDEFSTRFNFIAVDYLMYTHEVIGNIRQSYPVAGILTVIFSLASLIVVLLRRHIEFRTFPLKTNYRLALTTMAVILPTAANLMTSIDDMEFSSNAYANELVGNGWFSMAAAMRRNELDYDRFYRVIPQEEAEATLKTLNVRRLATREFSSRPPDRVNSTPMAPFQRTPRHVVLITVESLSAEFLGSYGSTKGLTPEMDRLAANGYRFNRLLATGTRTVRGLEALSLGTPPIPGQAIVRRPDNGHLATIGELLEHQGVNPYFIYGGYGYFDNMNAYFAANDYHVIDRTDIPKEAIVFENVWGVADESLFDQTLKTMNHAVDRGESVFIHVMTTSNHRPYTYPDGRIDIPSPGGRAGAVKYTDHAIGGFIRQAKTQPWFRDTLFVIVADHCASVAGKSKLPVANYRIPVIFYGPDLLAPGEDNRLASQIDLAPTLLQIMGKQGGDQFFGQSLLSPESKTENERAFISNYQELGYLKGNILTVLSPRQKVEAFRIDPQTLAATPTEPEPKLVRETVAYYQTSARAFKQGTLLSPDYPGLFRR